VQTKKFQRYKEAHLEEAVQQRAFLKLQPYFVKSMKDKNVCCCVYHVEVQLFKDAVNRMRDRRLEFTEFMNAAVSIFVMFVAPQVLVVWMVAKHIVRILQERQSFGNPAFAQKMSFNSGIEGSV
jgi:hypothetical protein